MFVVQWIIHFNEKVPLETEYSIHQDLDDLVLSCKEKLPFMRLFRAQTPPDGFLVFDASGREVRRWMGIPTTDSSPTP